MKEYRAFVNHKHNGVHLKFPNGNGISTVWGRGTYGDNYHYGDDKDLNMAYSTLIKEGANQVEIMIDTPDKKLHNRIFRKLKTSIDNGVIGWVTMEQWLWVISQLSKEVK